uniref:LYR motif-containing protein 4 n=1 Tax=Lepeophtheirus salmonis TaxID=72036 RepID=D3PIA9_LEPSM|nr:LYR motif-containing protein 4 [Lepeophtheirus salmonis]
MSSKEVLRLYKEILREGGKFADYNFRSFAIRRSRDAFVSNKNLTDRSEIDFKIKEAKDSIALIKRQTTISQLFAAPESALLSQKLI